MPPIERTATLDGPAGEGASGLMTTLRDEAGEPVASGLPPELRHERFRIGDKLGEGGMGVVYKARDARDGREVALKLMKSTLSGTARRRFEREFRSLSLLQHPHCLGVYEYGELDGGPFFTMELFQGQPISSLRTRPLRERFEPLLQLTHAIDYIHAHGIIHRDVKPSNVLVRPAGKEDGSQGYESRLMDFGLAKYYGVKSSLSAEAGFVGTVAYCSPEQINLDELDHRADLYCLGLVAYEVLSGRYAFPEARLAGMRPLIQAQLNDRPTPLAELDPEIPPGIADAVMKYLRKKPRRRPDSAGALRSAIAEVLGVDDPTFVMGVSLPGVRPSLSVTGFVCRAQEQAALDDVIGRSLRPSSDEPDGLPSAIVVSGEPGIGKSSVVQEAERLARGHGCQVYEGRCFDGNQSPFQPFVEILRRLIAELKLQERREVAEPDVDLTGTHVAGLPSQAFAKILSVVNDYRAEILRIAPELRKYLPGPDVAAPVGAEPEYIFRTLSAFFLDVASYQPICMTFEDLQWADKSSLDLLRHLSAALATARKPGSDRTPKLLIVASARTGYAGLDPILEQLRERRELLQILLEPLKRDETRELIALRLNCPAEELSDELIGRVDALCGGNPFFIAETIRDWFEKQAIKREEDRWVLSTESGDSSDLPETVRDVMRLRLQGLAPFVQQVVGAASVIGALVDIDLLRESLPDLRESDVLDAIDLLIPRRVFRETGDAGRVEFVHDLLREIPYSDLSASRRRSLHRRVGETLEQRHTSARPISPAILAEHFRNADDRERGFKYSVEAAKQSIQQFAFNNAVTQLKQALEILPADAAPSVKHELWSLMGQACGSSRRLKEAIQAHEQALSFASTTIERAKAQFGIGENYHREGDYDRSLEHMAKVMKWAGYTMPSTTLGRLGALSRANLFLYGVPSFLLRRIHSAETVDLLHVASSAGYLCSQMQASRNILAYLDSSYRIATIAKRLGLPGDLAFAMSKFAFNMGLFGLSGVANYHVKLTRKYLDREIRDISSARAVAHIGCVDYAQSKLREAESLLLDSAVVLDRVCDYFGTFNHHFLRHLYSITGEFQAEQREAEAECFHGESMGDQEAKSWGQYGIADAYAHMGRIDEARVLAQQATTTLLDRKSTAAVVSLATQGFIELQASKYRAARTYFDQCFRLMTSTGAFFEVTGLVYPMRVEALLGPDWSNGPSGFPKTLLKQANRESRLARFTGWLFPNYGAHSYRVSGRAAAAMGKTAKAAGYFRKAIAAAEKIGARYDLARAYLDAARVIPEKADEYERLGHAILNEIGGTIPEAERTPPRLEDATTQH